MLTRPLTARQPADGPRTGRLAPLLLALAAGGIDAAPQIPLCPGLTVVTAVSQPNGDYESIKRVEAVDAQGIRLKYFSEAPNTGLFASADESVIRTLVYRRVLAEDLASARDYQQIFVADADELIPGTTALGTSAAVLKELESKGEATIRLSMLPPDTPLRAERGATPAAYDYFGGGTIERLGTTKIPVIVNDRLVELIAVHARGQVAFEESEFYFLDDERNPLTLRMRLGIGAIRPMDPALAETCAGLAKAGVHDFRNMCLPEGGDRDTLQVVKISYPCDGPSLPPAGGGGGGGGAGTGDLELPGGGGGGGGFGDEGTAEGSGGGGGDRTLEEALEETGRADVYSIYFAFDSDEILEESEPTLAEIAALMRKHPEWRLRLTGHTDSIASDSYNLDLSRRRAGATMKALVERHGIAAERLTASGAGESSPIDTNDTLEGRARNRRVELARMQ